MTNGGHPPKDEKKGPVKPEKPQGKPQAKGKG